jgi:hypothetical protein
MQVSVGDTGTGGGTPGGVLSMAAPAPNPCSGAASVVYTIPSPGIAELSVFDLSGRVVATLSSGQLGAGEHTAVWDASGEPAGLYVVRLETGSGSVSQKLMVAR